MKYIYCLQNKINGKRYIGQTNNYEQRMKQHKSNAFNTNSKAYNYPLYQAIRKYGWDNFTKEIIEEIPEEETCNFVDEREIFFINYYDSLKDKNGYNITTGGQGNPKQSLSYEEKIKTSKLFAPEEIKNIQNMLKNGENTVIIREKYWPRLTRSFLDNINAGLNFKNEEWTYPLHKYSSDKERSTRFTKQEIQLIKEDIRSGMKYVDISSKWDISLGMISNINNGSVWNNNIDTYPLCIKSHSYKQNAETWVKDVQKDLLYSNLPIIEIAKKYNKSYSTIKKINSGSSHRKKEYKYPLTSNRIN